MGSTWGQPAAAVPHHWHIVSPPSLSWNTGVRRMLWRYSWKPRVEAKGVHSEEWHSNGRVLTPGQGLTFVHFSTQLEPCLTQENTRNTLNTLNTP
jgi:hypothetical protein